MSSEVIDLKKADAAVLWWSGRLGRTTAEIRLVGRQWILAIGDWQTVVGPEIAVRHRSGLFGQRIIVEQSGRRIFTHRYQLPWPLQLAPSWGSSPELCSAGSVDPGLYLGRVLAGTGEWA